MQICNVHIRGWVLFSFDVITLKHEKQDLLTSNPNQQFLKKKQNKNITIIVNFYITLP